MSSPEEMQAQAASKLMQGFRCLKFKVGANAFEEELALLRHLRSVYSPEQLEIRLDANGAFAAEDALAKLEALAEFEIHSIEQPIAPRQYKALEALCRLSPIPLALDEELIRPLKLAEKMLLLETILPHYLILKPTLLGGFAACEEWIALCAQLNIGWWATSALESNIGLNAIAQWVANIPTTLPQGLGTGALYANNIASPLIVEGAELWHHGNTWGPFE
jgi:L-alanine-DL-glutamate epimerase-like enolase superfamily enzyme